MKEYPIIFSGPSILAILADRKTQTRRVVNRVASIGRVIEFGKSEVPGYDWTFRDRRMLWHDLTYTELMARCPYGVSGDRLWVKTTLWVSDCGRYFAQNVGSISEYDVLDRQTRKRWQWPRYTPTGWDDKDRRYTHPECVAMVGSWSLETNGFALGFSDHDTSKRIEPLSGNTILKSYHASFRRRVSSQRCPRWASPLTLERTTNRPPERLQEISEADCEAEGLDREEDGYEMDDVSAHLMLRPAFAARWDSLNAKRGHGWDVNDWVWPIGFAGVGPIQNR